MDYIATYIDGSKTTALSHHGIKRMKWGVRRYQNYDGTLTELGKERYGVGTRKDKNQTVFVSGSSKTQDTASGYYRKKLPYDVRSELRSEMKKGNKIIVGDAPGIDRQVQDYLAKKNYDNVEVFSPGKEGARYLAKDSWKQTNVDKPDAEVGSKEWLAEKDKLMSKLADKGIAVTLDEGSTATRRNVDRLVDANKDVFVYEIGKDKGRLRKFLFGDDDKATYFRNGREISEEYDEWSDPYNSEGKTTREWGTRTLDIGAERDIAQIRNNLRYMKEGSGLESSGKARYTRETPEKSSGRYKTGSKSGADTYKPNKDNWKEVSKGVYEPTEKLSKQPKGKYVSVIAKNGSRSMVRIDDKASAAVTLGFMGLSQSEIASKLGISEDQLKKELASYKSPAYNGGIGVGRISKK